MDRPTELIDALRTLFESCKCFDTRAYEEQPSEPETFSALVPIIQGELDGALSLVHLVLDYYEPIADAELKPRQDGDWKDPSQSRSRTAQTLVDLCFVARIELVQQSERLQSLTPASEPWTIIEVCASTRRRILRSVSALEDGICRREGFVSAQMFYPSELQSSLQIRRAYGRFRKAVTRGKAPDGHTIHTRLRAALREFSVIVDGPIYQDLRAEDRRHFYELKQQIDAWFEKGNGRDTAHGLKIFENLVNFAHLLVEVNNRSELREYDSRILSEVYLHLFGGSERYTHISEEVLAKVRVLYGRDDELDHLMNYAEDSPVELWRLPLARLMASSLVGAEHTRLTKAPKGPSTI